MRIKSYRYILILSILFFILGCKDSTYKTDNTNSNTASIVTVNKAIAYDSIGRVTKEDLGDGKHIEYTYDTSGNLLSQKVTGI